MKLAIKDNIIVARVTDSYVAPEGITLVSEPANFDFEKSQDYVYQDSQLKQTVPLRVTMRQARLALLGAGMYTNVDAILNSLPVNQKAAALIEWEYALFVSRNSTLVNMLGSALGLTSTQLDDLFIAANAIGD